MNSNVARATGARQFDADAAEAIGESAARSSVPRVCGAAALSTCKHELLSRLPHPPVSAYRLPWMRRHARACCSAAWPNRRGVASERALRVASTGCAGRWDRELSPSPAAGRISLASAARARRLRDPRRNHHLLCRSKRAAVSRSAITRQAALPVRDCARFPRAQVASSPVSVPSSRACRR